MKVHLPLANTDQKIEVDAYSLSFIGMILAWLGYVVQIPLSDDQSIYVNIRKLAHHMLESVSSQSTPEKIEKNRDLILDTISNKIKAESRFSVLDPSYLPEIYQTAIQAVRLDVVTPGGTF